MKKRTVIITGANSGIGKAAAQKFALEGYHVIMACRNIERAGKVQEELKKISKNDKVDLMEVDMSSFRSIQQFCSTYTSKFEKLDILIHNAAYFNHGEKMYQLSPDNIEMTFATNTFGPYLMTSLLVEHMKKSDDPRILHACTNNIRHFFNPKRKIKFDNLQGEFKSSRKYSVYKNYGDSKMALLMLTFKMADAYKKEGIKINAIEISGAKMSKETLNKFKPHYRAIARMQNLYFPPPSAIANNYFDICTSKHYENSTGKLFTSNGKILQAAPEKPGLITQVKQLFGSTYFPNYAIDKDNIEKVWELTRNLTKTSMIKN